jgi:K+-transporting ATPase ATPase C chain
MIKQIKPALRLFLTFVVITGGIYPFLTTAIAQIVFPYQANGSLILHNNQVVGSTLIGQQFTAPQYFWGRLSDTGDYPYQASASGGSNFSVLNQGLVDAADKRIADLKAADPGNVQPIPVDLVTASASGLDPDISPAAAYYQAGRVARVRHLSVDQVNTLITQHTQGRMLGFLGEARVNVLALNWALDGLQLSYAR